MRVGRAGGSARACGRTTLDGPDLAMGNSQAAVPITDRVSAAPQCLNRKVNNLAFAFLTAT
jgi:hypothetical protein